MPERAPFRLPEDEATLVLDDGRYAGAEIDCRLSVGYNVYAYITGFVRDAARGTAEEELVERAIEVFVDEVLIGWNLADHKGPIPATVEGMKRLTPTLIGQIISTWASLVGQASPPLGTPATPKRRGAGSRRKTPPTSPR